jgi:SpoVK/Ycf46/Vps4 family AAA+-type ATPase
VRDSHDRFANVEVSYLLQRIEAFRGLAVLTTNLEAAIDPAFMRRLRFVVHFTFPDAAQRAEIWRRVLPPRAPLGALDFARLGKLAVAGGSIRNIALTAAFLSAADGEPLGMEQILRAARSEYAKLQKSPSDAEIAGWQ